MLKSIFDETSNSIVIEHSKNFGSFAAIQTGLKHASGDCVTILSADLQEPPMLVYQMLERWIEGYDVVICQRTTRDDPLFTKLFAKFYYWALRYFVDKNYPKKGFSSILFDKKIVSYASRANKNTNLLVYIVGLGFKLYSIDYERQLRRHGKSRWSFSRKVDLFFDTLFGFSRKPLRFLIFTMFLLGIACFSYSVFIIQLYVREGIAIPGWASLMTFMSIMFSMTFIMIAVLAEYIWRIFDQLNGRPVGVVKHVFKK